MSTPAPIAAAMAPLATPVRIGPLTLRNRTVKAATYEGMTPKGAPSPQLIEHHRRLAQGGVAMTTVAYCAVDPDGRTFAEQLSMSDDTVPDLRRLTDAVHGEGAAVSLQLGHAGAFTKNKELRSRGGVRGPSRGINAYGLVRGLGRIHAINEAEMRQVADAFAAALNAAEDHLAQKLALAMFGPLLVRPVPYHDAFFFDDAQRLVDAVPIPVGLLGGVVAAHDMLRALERGFAFVVMGRALIRDPDFVQRILRGEVERSDCTHCNKCVAEMGVEAARGPGA